MLNRILFITIILFLLCSFNTRSLRADEPLPLRVRLLLSKVVPLQEKGKLQEAVAMLAEFQNRGRGDIKSIYNHPAVNFALGNCLLIQGKHTEALNAYKSVVARDPKHMAAWQNMASCQYETGAYEKAAYSFNKAYQLSEPKKAELLYYAATSNMLADRPRQAITLFETLFANHPAAVKLQWRETLVHAFLDVDKGRKALGHMEILARDFTGEKQQEWQKILLYQYLNLSMPEKALALATRLSHQSPTNPLWWKGLTHIHLQAERHEEALASLTIYSLLTPLNPEEQKLLADLNLQEGVPVKASALYEKFLNNKRDPNIVKRLAQAYLQQDRVTEALESLERFGKDIKDPALTLLRADLLYRVQHYQEAAKVYEEVAEEYDDQGRAWLMAGYCHWQLKNYQAAHNAFKKAAASKKQQKEANLALTRLIKQQKLD